MKTPIYLDYAATTPVDPRVAEKMIACLTMDGNFGNPASRSHIFGWRAEEAVEGAHIVYARSWQSLDDYGNPTLAASRRARSAGWIVDEALMALGEDARLMHAMPVRRNVEVTDEVLDGKRSLLYEQAANRLPSQMALLVNLLR